MWNGKLFKTSTVIKSSEASFKSEAVSCSFVWKGLGQIFKMNFLPSVTLVYSEFGALCTKFYRGWSYAYSMRTLTLYSSWKGSKCGVYSGSYFLVFELNMAIYGVNLRIQSECRKIRTRKNSVFGYFSRSGTL